MKSTLLHKLKIATFSLFILLAAFILWWLFQTPSNNRDWSVDQAVLPYTDFSSDGSTVTIHNIRNTTYRTTSDFDVHYYDKTFNVNDIKKVWFLVEPFAGYRGAAHTLLSFEFNDNQFVSISVEIRKEKGESFSAIKGLLNQYELTYVIADEQDVIKLRSNYRHDQVFLYPINASQEKAKTLFIDMLTRANKLKGTPEFYNTLLSTCTTNIVAHVNKISPHKIPLRSEIIFPADADKLAYDVGLIDTTLSFEEARQKFNINERANLFGNDPLFSLRIRQ